MSDLPIVSTTLSLAMILAEPARRQPETVAVIQGDNEYTYAEVWERARKVAAELIEEGIKPGDRVGILAPNVIEFITTYFGILAAGGVVIPVPALLQGPEAAYLLDNARASLLMYHPSLADTAKSANEHTGTPIRDMTSYGVHTEPISHLVSRQPMDPAVIFFTSGTTGKPKGAMLTHFNLVMNCTVAAYDGNNGPDGERLLACLPMFHVFGQSVSLNATFRKGGTVVLQPRFNAAEALKIMDKLDVKYIAAVPTMYVQMLRAAQQDPTLPRPKLEDAISGGASLPLAILEQFEEMFQTKIHEGYGLSETSPTIANNQEIFGVEAGTVGHAIWGMELAIADPSITDHIEFMPYGERGEIVTRGHAVFAGYWDNPKATQEVLQDGWFRTGDVGIQDETGRVRIVDRTKDLVIRGGYNVYPREIEEVLSRHPSVGQVAVIGVPDDQYGEEVTAVVVPAQGQNVDPGELITWSREKLGKHKYPRRVEVVDELPLGPTMKVLKRELRSRFAPAS